MEELKLLNPKAFDWLAARDAKHYSSAFFSTFPKCDMLCNNICESWNSCILNFRDKPVLTMCENLRIYLMTRMRKNRDSMLGYPHKICDNIFKIIEKGKERATRYRAYKSIGGIYQVDDDNFKPFRLDLSQRQCSCRRWDLTGNPCTHAIAAIRKNGELPEDYVHKCYRIETYLKAYEPAILPIHASDLWYKINLPPPLPPKYKAQPGRPKKKRKVDPITEAKEHNPMRKALKKGEGKTCRVCGMTGNNKTTCKAKNAQNNEDVANVVHNVAVETPIQGQFQDVVVESQVPNFVLEEMELMTSQPTQDAQSEPIEFSSFISSQVPSTSGGEI